MIGPASELFLVKGDVAYLASVIFISTCLTLEHARVTNHGV